MSWCPMSRAGLTDAERDKASTRRIIVLLLLAHGAFVGLVVLCSAVLIGGTQWGIKSSTVYLDGMALAAQDERVQATLGEPIDAGWIWSASASFKNDSGSAVMRIPLEGPEAEGELFLQAEKSAGDWTFGRAEVQVDSTSIDLLVPVG